VAEAGIRLRPHVKVHECAEIAKLQIEAGACGVEVGPLAQAEAMAEAGINDINIAHPNFYGGPKLEILKKLLKKPGLKITIVVDMIEQAEGISQAGQATGRKVPVLIKLDTSLYAGGIRRHGVLPGEPALTLAKKLCQLPGIEFKGIYAHEMGSDEPTAAGVEKVALKTAEITTETARMLMREGFTIEHVSVGASPTFRTTCRYIKEGKFPEITEIHPGNYVIGDLMYMKLLSNTRETCAVTVLATVTSTTHEGWAMIDTGYKALGSESLIGWRETPGFYWEEMPSFGFIQGRPDLWLGSLSAESAHVFYKDTQKNKLNPGERLEIIPNNATLVINIHNQLYGVRNGAVERVLTVTGRGRGS
jgi:D-serine deaminase-like pyridoxal phosphate-dependent protein